MQLFSEQKINTRMDKLVAMEHGFNIAKEGKYETFYAWQKAQEKLQEKKEYEILSYSYKNWIYKKNNLGEFSTSFDAPAHLLILHPENMDKIHSVKRLSDNEIFTVGDKIKGWGETPVIKIEKFQIDSFDNTKISAYHNNGYGRGISSWEKIKQPLFTTEDGVAITDENQTLYAVLTKAQWETREDTFKRMRERSQFSAPLNSAWKYFSTDEARLHYTIRNKPLLSWNDVLNLFREYGSSTHNFFDAVFEKSKSKI
jgi:hypothetical protein